MVDVGGPAGEIAAGGVLTHHHRRHGTQPVDEASLVDRLGHPPPAVAEDEAGHRCDSAPWCPPGSRVICHPGARHPGQIEHHAAGGRRRQPACLASTVRPGNAPKADVAPSGLHPVAPRAAAGRAAPGRPDPPAYASATGPQYTAIPGDHHVEVRGQSGELTVEPVENPAGGEDRHLARISRSRPTRSSEAVWSRCHTLRPKIRPVAPAAMDSAAFSTITSSPARAPPDGQEQRGAVAEPVLVEDAVQPGLLALTEPALLRSQPRSHGGLLPIAVVHRHW